MTRTEAAAAPKNDAPELPDEVSTPRDAATASAELTVDTAWLGEYLLGRWADDRKASRKLASRPEFWFQGDLSLAEHRARVLGQLHLLVKEDAVHRAFPKRFGGRDDAGGNIAAFEELVLADPSLQIKSGVQWGLFAAAILHLGTERHHEQFLPDAMSLEIPGAFAMTERGHGSDVASIGTTATLDEETDEWVIHTPFAAAWKEYLGNAALHGRAATVFAQLIVKGVNYGVHCIYVPIRDANGELLPGVSSHDDGLKGGLNGIDNGRLAFDQVRVPRTNLLNRYGDVDENGVYTSPIESPGRRFFTMLGTLVQGRVSLDGASTLASKLALHIAITYGTQRRQFTAGTHDEEVLLDYQRHQRRLLPRLAQTYAMSFAHEEFLELFDRVFSGEEDTLRPAKTLRRSRRRSSRSPPGPRSRSCRRPARPAAARASWPRTASPSCAPTSTSTPPSRATTTCCCSSSPSACSPTTRSVSRTRMPGRWRSSSWVRWVRPRSTARACVSSARRSPTSARPPARWASCATRIRSASC
ncbi:hypothetical protein GCM10025869_14000 [Homoserinibacter gongjuensis]|uniref:Acyl-CoA oxidase n=1 Tax=Homoserinibacter gongjuensis TaxID=1162968 RepID=A0ABQ6JTN3_9MICO|nr:hypothetical protein GCM10025869_14000 [Homoserinibacter gongjuensis]